MTKRMLALAAMIISFPLPLKRVLASRAWMRASVFWRTSGENSRDAGFGVGATLTALARAPSRDNHRLVFGANLSIHASYDGTDDCIADPQTGQCLPTGFPSITSWSLLGGVRITPGEETVQLGLLLGPTLFDVADGARVGGATFRFDLGVPARGHLAVVLWAQGSLIPRLNRQRRGLMLFGLGLRGH